MANNITNNSLPTTITSVQATLQVYNLNVENAITENGQDINPSSNNFLPLSGGTLTGILTATDLNFENSTNINMNNSIVYMNSGTLDLSNGAIVNGGVLTSQTMEADIYYSGGTSLQTIIQNMINASL